MSDSSDTNNLLKTDIKRLKGIGEKRAEGFHKLGIDNIGDLLYYFPRKYIDTRSITNIADADIGVYAAVICTVASEVKHAHIRRGMDLFKFTAFDDTSSINITYFNNKYIASRIKKGDKYLFYGKIDGNLIDKSMNSPKIKYVDKFGNAGDIEPIYPLGAAITQFNIQSAVKQALSIADGSLTEILPEWVVSQYNLLPRKQAILSIHFPKNEKLLDAARRRMIFEELLFLALGMALLKKRSREDTGIVMKNKVDINNFYKRLPFVPTNAQKRCIDEALGDIFAPQSSPPMNRLVQGDVGSGKTMVAAALCYVCAKNNIQCALMVPTEILALQHFKSLAPLLDKSGVKTAVLTGSQKAAVKKSIYDQLERGEIDFIIGTHALIQKDVKFHNLGLVITDEQHRFGVNQRALLSSKGDKPHTLVMSATPIPRTLALIMYGDLDISVIDELPPGRQKIDTFCVNSGYKKRLYKFMQEQISDGGQCYIVCPLVEENKSLELESVNEYAGELQKIFPRLNIGVIHGKLKSQEKDDIMRAFIENKIQILVSTTVIEVGVDVPNANLMIIENAERFGLSQLHQLRGRVGRGTRKSYCVLISDNKNELTKERLSVMARESDGFKISEADLKLRGPGDFFGSKQHGLPPLKIADLNSDMDILISAQHTAAAILESDSKLSFPENLKLLESVEELFHRSDGEIYN